ncbi:hypothetical protein AFL94_08840 [Arthrobacter sp. LS16]|nr:hypothetical protein AFL94_08840 [Arthrobacter sp. LS16]
MENFVDAKIDVTHVPKESLAGFATFSAVVGASMKTTRQGEPKSYAVELKLEDRRIMDLLVAGVGLLGLGRNLSPSEVMEKVLERASLFGFNPDDKVNPAVALQLQDEGLGL